MAHIRSILFLVLLLLAPAQAADVVFPVGSRVGLAPPPGMVASKNFFGFEDRNNAVAVMIVVLPAEAYADIEKSTTTDALKKQGITAEAREALTLPLGKAILVVGRQTVEKANLHKWILLASAPGLTAIVTVQMPDAAKNAYPDAAIRAALTSIAVRPTVPDAEQLSLLPFKVGELAGFRIGGVLAGRAIMLTDAAPDATASKVEPHIVVAVAPGGPPQTQDRDAFARDVLATIPNLKDVRINTSESLRIGGQQGHQILAHGKDFGGAEITIVQWLRFGGGAYMHVIGVARTDAWTSAYARFRSVRDSIEPR